MKLARVRRGNEVYWGVLRDGVVTRLAGPPYGGIVETKEADPWEQVRLLCPAEPTKVVCVGKNYLLHAQEMQEGVPQEPLLFLKPPSAVIGPEDEIVYPSLSRRVDYEGELAVVIGKACRQVEPAHALEYVLGYTCLNDVTARDLQKKDGQWTRGKGFDTFCPIGPWLETELDPGHAAIQTRLNGTVVQRSSTELLIHSVPVLIAYISQVMTLLPGDVIATGTPEHVGPMQAGDIIEVEIGGIGTLRNRVVNGCGGEGGVRP